MPRGGFATGIELESKSLKADPDDRRDPSIPTGSTAHADDDSTSHSQIRPLPSASTPLIYPSMPVPLISG
eukprot:gene26191-biopygen14771